MTKPRSIWWNQTAHLMCQITRQPLMDCVLIDRALVRLQPGPTKTLVSRYRDDLHEHRHQLTSNPLGTRDRIEATFNQLLAQNEVCLTPANILLLAKSARFPLGLQLISRGQRSVGDLVKIFPATRSLSLRHAQRTRDGGFIAGRRPCLSTLNMFGLLGRSARGGGPVRVLPFGSALAGKALDAAGAGVVTGMLVPLMGDSYNGCFGMKLLLG